MSACYTLHDVGHECFAQVKRLHQAQLSEDGSRLALKHEGHLDGSIQATHVARGLQCWYAQHCKVRVSNAVCLDKASYPVGD